MAGANAAELVNFVGFITGAVLYAMLLALVLRSPARATAGATRDPLPLATALLGLIWNIGELFAYLLGRLGWTRPSIALAALSFPALGLLAAVVVQSVARTIPRGALITAGAYVSAVAASVLHVLTVLTGDPSSSAIAFTLLTVSFAVVIVALATMTRRQPNGPRALWMLALTLFAVSATHLGRVHAPDSNWLIELAGHHAAIPLAFAILYQDYRFALADLFLKQALTLLVLVTMAFGGYSLVAGVGGTSSLAVGALLVLWIGSTLSYPWIRRQIVSFVDAVILGRVDYAVVRAAVAQELATLDTIEVVLDICCVRLGEALNARRVEWHGVADRRPSGEPALTVAVPTADQPTFEIGLYDLAGGRRLLSDDEALAEALAAIAARRIDALRMTTERYELRLREEEMQKLAAEAELKALRAQINPHFLFNALTTIGYLIDHAPARALDTLLRLTNLLRAVLRSDGEFTTLGREIELVQHYLDIERARFEERLRVRINVPRELRQLRIPSLVVQPLVENAVKHGIAPSVPGGEVRLDASLVVRSSALKALRIDVRNTGAPLGQAKRRGGVGLANVERRLTGHYGNASSLTVTRTPDGATVATIELPLVQDSEHAHRESDTARIAGR